MGDGHPKMKDISAVFENRYKLLLTDLSELDLGFEETFGPEHLKITCQEDKEKGNVLDDKSASSSRCQSATSHPKLRRSHSDGAYSMPLTLNSTGRSALSLCSSTTRLPNLPLRRLSSNSIATGNTVQAITTWHINNQGVNGVKRNSIPEDSEAHRHRDLARRLSSSRYAATRWRRVSASTCRDSKWRVKLHKRSLSVEDDDGSDLGSTLSRGSSSSGFSSQSSLF